MSSAYSPIGTKDGVEVDALGRAGVDGSVYLLPEDGGEMAERMWGRRAPAVAMRFLGMRQGSVGACPYPGTDYPSYAALHDRVRFHRSPAYVPECVMWVA